MAVSEVDEFSIDDSEEQSDGKSGSGKKLMLVSVFLLLLGGGGAGVYFSGMLEKDTKEIAEADKPAAPPPPAKSIYFDLPDMLVNLNSINSKPHFLKLRASLELDSDVDVAVLRPLQPRIIDKFQVYVRELRLEDLRANGGMQSLREELRMRINEAIKPVKVRNVLFRNLLVQ